MFSVIIPVHNKLPHLERSINSVLNQSFQDFELLLIDDASTDGSSEKLLEFNDPRIRRFRREEPGPGGYAARNLGIKEAKFEWIAFLDADDEWLPDHLEKMKVVAKDFPQISLMSCGYQIRDRNHEEENAFYNKYKDKGNIEIDLREYLFHSLSKRRPVWTSVAFIRKESPISKELFPAKTGAKRGGDLYAWLKMMCFHKKMIWSDHVGAVYYLDNTNMVTKTAKASPQLMSKNAFNELSGNLDHFEKKLLRKYMNASLKSAYLGALNREEELFNLTRMIYWKGDLYNALKLFILSLVPKRGLLLIKKLKHRI